MKNVCLKKIGLLSMVFFLFYCSNDKSDESKPNKDVEIHLDKTEMLLEEHGCAQIVITTNDEVAGKANFLFSYSKEDIANVEYVKGRYYVNGDKIGASVITVKYKGEVATCKVTVKKREIPIDFRFIRIVDNTHALPYLKQGASYKERQAAEAYIDEQLEKQRSVFKRIPLKIPNDEYLQYVSKKSIESKSGILETLYGAAAQGYLAGYSTLKEAEGFLSKAFGNSVFRPISDDMYDKDMYAYVYEGNDFQMLVVLQVVENENYDFPVIWMITGPWLSS